jgi:hypothetical protein
LITADAPSLAQEILKQMIPFFLDKGVRSGHDPARPIQIAKGKYSAGGDSGDRGKAEAVEAMEYP